MSKFIGAKVDVNLSVFKEISKQFPSIVYGILSEVGYIGRRALYEDFMKGQVIDLMKERDSAGKRTVLYSLAKNRKSVKISSYPLNLYDPERVYSAASATVESKISTAMKTYDEKVLQKRIDQMDSKK